MLLLAFAYFALSVLTLCLPLPWGESSPIWPATGIALAGILLGGYRYFPSILLGSFAANLVNYINTENETTFKWALLIAFVIAVGASLQAVISAYLIKKVVKAPAQLEQGREIGAIMLLGGPIGCMINASIGASILTIAGVVPSDAFLTNWFTWWVGDLLGVIVFAPLALVMVSSSISVARKKVVAIPIIIFLGAVIAVFSFVQDIEKHSVNEEFSMLASREATFMQEHILAAQTILNSIGWFYRTSDNVTRENFSIFVEESLKTYKGIQALEWIPRIARTEKEAYEALVHKDGYPDFRIVEKSETGMIPVSAREEYFPVYYVEPYETNKMAFGFDLGSNPARLSALQEARDSGKQVATAPIFLVQETGSQYGFLIFNPIYEINKPTDTFAERQKHLKGFALGVFRIGDIVNQIHHGTTKERINLYIYDNLISGEKADLYGKQASSDAFTYSTVIAIAGRQWTLEFSPTAAYLQHYHSWQSRFLLVGGLFFASLLQAFLLILTARAEIVRRLVSEQTVEINQAKNDLEKAVEHLTTSNEELERFAYIASHDLQEPLRMVTSFSALLEEEYRDKLDDTAKEYIEYSASAAQQMQDLVNDLLDYAKLNDQELLKEELDANQLLKTVQDNLIIAINDSKAQLTFDQMPMITANPVSFMRIIQNLISNGIKYQSDGNHPKIHVGIEENESEWTISVNDNGIGIEAEYFEKIFMPFKRLHGKTEYVGTGIGLAICKKMTEDQGGRIWVDSTFGKGSTFYFTLPR